MTANWDLVLLVFLAVSMMYSFLLKEKIVVTLMGAYVGMVVANQWGDSLQELVNRGSEVLNQEFVRGGVSVPTVQIAALAIVILIVAFKGGIIIHPQSVGGGPLSYIVLTLYGLMTAGLIAWAVISYLPSGTREAIVLGSNIAEQLMRYGNWWVILPIILMFIVNFRGYDN